MPSQSASQTQQRLDFAEPLLQKGKKENADALSRRLKTLYQKLAVLDQDLTDVDSLHAVMKPLISPLILHHKDRGVKAYAACCLADLLRVYAPDAPYTGEQLRDIFQFFCTQLLINLKPSPVRPLQPTKTKNNEASQSQTQGASSQRVTDVPFYTEYCYLLESLATIKSVVLACDVPGGDDLITEFFQGFVEIVRPDMSKSIIRHLVNILVALTEEASSIPSGVMDCIIDQFENHSKSNSPAFQMIVDVCNKAADRLQRPILAHFSEIQLAHGRNPTQEDMKVLSNSHDLILSIWQYAPGLLLNVIPLLEENLRAVDEVNLRARTTRTLGTMFGIRPRVGASVADLARAYPATWRSWLGRKLDKATQVRLTWAESSTEALNNSPDLRKDLERELVDRITDSNEHVRAAICRVFGTLEQEVVLHHVKIETLQAIGLRMSDKKAIVREAALMTLAKMWCAARSEINQNLPEAVAHFAWIPQAMLGALQKKDAPRELGTQVTAVFKSKILPLPDKADDEDTWVESLLLVASQLDEGAFSALRRLTGLAGYARGASPYRTFLNVCEQNNGGIIEKEEQVVKARLNYVIKAIAVRDFTEVDKARRDLEAFAEANDARLYKLYEKLTDPTADLRAIIKSKNEFLRRIEQSHPDLLETLTTVITQATFNVINTSSVSALLKTIQTPSGSRKDAVALAAIKLLAFVSKECPPMFASHVPELLLGLGSHKNEKLVEVSLQALAALSKQDSKNVQKDKKLLAKIIKIGCEGTPRQAKFAARFLAYSGDKEAVSDLLEAILDQLSEKDESQLLSLLRALAELALSAPDTFETKAEELHRFLIQDILHQDSPSSEDVEGDVWIEEDALPVLDRAKIMGLRLLTHRALAFGRSDDAIAIVSPVLSVLNGVLKNDGQINQTTQEGGHTRNHLRLRAALCMIKLAGVKAFDKHMTNMFEPITYILQDPCYQVRNRMLIKLGEVLPAQRLLSRWNIMPAMVASDPERDNVILGKSVLGGSFRACANMLPVDKIERMELPFARLLLVLAHHPDLEEWSIGITKDMAKYIELYLDAVINRDNVGLLYHIANKVKSVKGLDAAGTPEEDNTNLYKLAELAQVMIKNRAETHHWTVTTYPGKIKLPKDVFHNLENSKVVLEVSRRTYLTEEELSWAKGLGKKANATAGPSRRAEPGSSPVKKRARPSKGTSSRKRSKRSADTDDESDEDPSDEEDDEDAVTLNAEESEEEEEEEGVAATLGRGGRRGAKTKANKGLKGKKSKVKKPVSKSSKVDSDSEMTELEDE